MDRSQVTGTAKLRENGRTSLLLAMTALCLTGACRQVDVWKIQHIQRDIEQQCALEHDALSIRGSEKKRIYVYSPGKAITGEKHNEQLSCVRNRALKDGARFLDHDPFEGGIQ
jgi:hypothetical protein